MNLTPIEYFRAALAQAMAEDLDMAEVWLAVDNAETPGQFDENISAIIAAKAAMQLQGAGKAWDSTSGQWVVIK